MKKTIKLVKAGFLSVLAATFVFTGVSTTQADTIFQDLFPEDLEVSATVNTAVYNKYVWRGFLLDDDVSIQPSAVVSVGPLEVGYWGSYDTENKDALASDETDGWIGLNFDLGFIDEEWSIVGVSVGHTWYAFPEADTYTTETYLSFSVDTFLSPYLTWYHDYGDENQGGADGDYIMLGVGHSFTLSEDYGISLDLGYEFGYNNEAFIADDGGYNLLTAGIAIPLTESATFTPSVGYSMPYGDIDDANDDEFYGGFVIEISG